MQPHLILYNFKAAIKAVIKACLGGGVACGGQGTERPLDSGLLRFLEAALAANLIAAITFY